MTLGVLIAALGLSKRSGSLSKKDSVGPGGAVHLIIDDGRFARYFGAFQDYEDFSQEILSCYRFYKRILPNPPDGLMMDSDVMDFARILWDWAMGGGDDAKMREFTFHYQSSVYRNNFWPSIYVKKSTKIIATSDFLEQLKGYTPRRIELNEPKDLQRKLSKTEGKISYSPSDLLFSYDTHGPVELIDLSVIPLYVPAGFGKRYVEGEVSKLWDSL